jgi:carbon monoxide dehydrogenase subunit G
MTTVSASISINQPVDKVFDYMVDVENHKAWQAGILNASLTPPGPIGVGSTYHYTTEVMGRQMETHLEVTACEKNQKWSVKTTGVPLSVEMDYLFEAVDNSTKLTISMELAGGYPAAAEAMVKQQTQKNFEDQCTKIKQLLEA